nr:DUF5606 domain-containing protein [Marinilabilia salmonicolor]
MLKGILAISGKPGLFKMITNAKNSIIVESLIDGKRTPAYASSKISSLEDISIFTIDGDTKLADVFVNVFEKNLDVNPRKPPQRSLRMLLGKHYLIMMMKEFMFLTSKKCLPGIICLKKKR